MPAPHRIGCKSTPSDRALGAFTENEIELPDVLRARPIKRREITPILAPRVDLPYVYRGREYARQGRERRLRVPNPCGFEPRTKQKTSQHERTMRPARPGQLKNSKLLPSWEISLEHGR